MASASDGRSNVGEQTPATRPQEEKQKRSIEWRQMLGNEKRRRLGDPSNRSSTSDLSQAAAKRPSKWSIGILNDKETEEVPGSVLLLSKVSEYNEPLGLRNAPARTSASSLPSPYPPSRPGSLSSRRQPMMPEKKRTKDGKIVLEPQPDDSANDPLNWGAWRRDLALMSLSFYCMVGGGMTPILAAGFHQVADEFHVSVPRVAQTTGLYMMGLGLGSVVLSPTAILFGKRPVYLVSAVCFILTSVWCALTPTFGSLVAARVLQGFAISAVECLPSATVAEIFYLHEKAYRLGIYTMLLLGGKNLVPLVSAAIIEGLGWRWVFWIVAMVVGFAELLLFLFVPETFWDRTPRARRFTKRRVSLPDMFKVQSWNLSPGVRRRSATHGQHGPTDPAGPVTSPARARHAHFEDGNGEISRDQDVAPDAEKAGIDETGHDAALRPGTPPRPAPQSPISVRSDYFAPAEVSPSALEAQASSPTGPPNERTASVSTSITEPKAHPYVQRYIEAPPKTVLQQLKPYSGRMSHQNWFKVAIRPFILFAYPSILWSTLVYSLSVGWLIVLSETVATIYQNRDSYHFTPLQTGLVYISPFVGGVLGTAVAGKLSDVIVRAMARKNGGIYEPEFRLVMGSGVLVFTSIGLMGFGWSAQERDAWIVPTIFFGFISFGCTLGSTTAITFAVDSYRQYAGEALVTL